MAEQKIKSLLAVDCGSITTKVALIEKKATTYRLVAHAESVATYGSPWHDMTLGIVDAIRKLEQRLDRQLLDHNDAPLMPQNSAGHGIDALAAVTSAAQPLNVLLAGLMSGVSLQTARRACATTYTTISRQFALDDDRPLQNSEHRIKAIQQAKPDLILIVGGVDGGADAPVIDMAHVIALALRRLPADMRPYLVYAGNTKLRAQLVEILGNVADFKPVNNILPSLKQEDLSGVQPELDILYQQQKMNQLPGFKTLSEWSGNFVVSTGKSFAQSIRYLGQSYNVNVLGVDVGCAATTIAASRSTFHHHIIRPDLGTGLSLPALLRQTTPENLQRWLPFKIDASELENFLCNKSLSPQTVPETYRELHLELAIVKEALRLIIAQGQQAWPTEPDTQSPRVGWDLIIGTGKILTGLTHHALAALVLLDGFEPAGICSLALDVNALLGMLGSVAAVEPLAAAQVIAYDSLLNLGTVVAPVGIGNPGDTAIKFKMTYEDDRQIEVKIPFGTIEVIPLEPTQKANLEIHPTGNFSMQPSGANPGRGVAALVEGGTLGVIIDTRGRPIALAKEEADRHLQQKEWLLKMGLSLEAVQPPINGDDVNVA